MTEKRILITGPGPAYTPVIYDKVIDSPVLLDEYQSLTEDFDNLVNKNLQIHTLIKSVGEHPSFILPPVSEFIRRLKEILNATKPDNI